MHRSSRLFFLSCTRTMLLRERMLNRYAQEAFESRFRLDDSKTYPGPIRAATPGDTRFYAGSLESILQDNDRHYWRAVTDDPQVQYLVPLRIRFKFMTWVTTGWEQRLQIVQVMAPRDSTIRQIIDLVKVENQSPYLCTSLFTLSIDGKELEPNMTIEEYGISEHSQIDAIEDREHLLHTEAERPKDWTVDEMTSESLNRSPYKEMGMTPIPSLAPRYEARPKGYFGRNNYSVKMDIRKETENVIAFADDVLSSINGCACVATKSREEPCQGKSIEALLDRPWMMFTGNDKIIQTDPLRCSVGTQGVSGSEVAVQCIVSCSRQMTQTEVVSSHAQTQTDPDVLFELIGAAIKEGTNSALTGNNHMDKKMLSLVERLASCEGQLQFLASKLKCLVSTVNVLTTQANDAERIIKMKSVENLEVESRHFLLSEEQRMWCEVTSYAKAEIMNFYRLSEEAFTVARNELLEKLDDIEVLNKQVKTQTDENTITSSSITDLASDCASRLISGGNDESDDAALEIQKLLTDCWIVLREDV